MIVNDFKYRCMKILACIYEYEVYVCVCISIYTLHECVDILCKYKIMQVNTKKYHNLNLRRI